MVDDRWRAVCFASGPPQGLASGMLGPLDQLREICGERRVMIGFDRGGSYPKAFSELRDRGFDWVTYRRAPLATPTVKPRSSWVTIDGRRHYVRVADEIVELDGYGTARQITLYEHGHVALQILTSDLQHHRGAPRAHAALPLVHREHLQVPRRPSRPALALRLPHGHRAGHHAGRATPSAPKRSRHCEATSRPSAELERKIGQHTTTSPTADTDPAQTLCMLRSRPLHRPRRHPRSQSGAQADPREAPRQHRSTPTRSARHHASTAARCKPSAGCSPTTPSSTSPAR